jgi:hypothetical protein
MEGYEMKPESQLLLLLSDAKDAYRHTTIRGRKEYYLGVISAINWALSEEWDLKQWEGKE